MVSMMLKVVTSSAKLVASFALSLCTLRVQGLDSTSGWPLGCLAEDGDGLDK